MSDPATPQVAANAPHSETIFPNLKWDQASPEVGALSFAPIEIAMNKEEVLKAATLVAEIAEAQRIIHSQLEALAEKTRILALEGDDLLAKKSRLSDALNDATDQLDKLLLGPPLLPVIRVSHNDNGPTITAIKPKLEAGGS